MGLVITKSYTCDLARTLSRTELDTALIGGDAKAHRIVITVLDGGKALDCTSGAVTAYYQRSDGYTVLITGTSSATGVSVVLPAACYEVPGRIILMVRLSMQVSTSYTTQQTVLWLEGWVQSSTTDSIISAGTAVPSLEQLLAKIAACEAATVAANTAAGKANDAVTTATTAAKTANDAADAANAAADVISNGRFASTLHVDADNLTLLQYTPTTGQRVIGWYMDKASTLIFQRVYGF